MITAIVAACLLAPRSNAVEARLEPLWRRAQAQQQTPPGQKSAPLTPDQQAERTHQIEMNDDRVEGKKFAADADKELKPSDDKEATARVQRIGGILAELANRTHTIASWGDTRMNTYDYTFKLVKGKDVNAFSLPGGYIYVYEGLVKYVESDDELAGVLAHEISHAKFRHIATLQHEQTKLNKVTLPLILLAILTGGVGALAPALGTSGLINQAEGSGWSVKAETAADFGGLQLVEKSQWNPTGMLTVMERLANDERYSPEARDMGIFRSHPPSQERADTLMQHMHDAGVPIQRSRVTTSFRAMSQPMPDGTVQVIFSKKTICSFAGPDAAARAQTACDRLNVFFDATPGLFEVTRNTDGWVYGLGKPLLKITDDDAKAAKKDVPVLQSETVENIKRGLYSLGYKTWSPY